jgi:alpha-L-fucosidase
MLMQTQKHHDGFALFDTGDSTHRSSVHLGPRKDFLGELMAAAKERHPDLRKGTYYSMPEWSVIPNRDSVGTLLHWD